MDIQRNVVGWFEVPVTDMERAMKFYETVLGLTLERHNMDPIDMAWFPILEEKGGSPGALVKAEGYVPSMNGTLVFFTAHSGDLENEQKRVEAAGGKVLKEKMSIGEYGFIAIIVDTEGNKVALHSRK